jgi:hypothetical protein
MLSNLTSLKISMGIALTDQSLDAQLEAFIKAADAVVKKWTKRDLESSTYTEFHSGDNRADVILRQRPATATTNVWVDFSGFWGQNPAGFPASTLLTLGQDYALVMDGPGGTVSNSGLLRRVGATGLQGFMGGLVYPSGLRQGTLSGWDRGVVWPTGDGNIKVQYTAGYTTIPADLQEATNQIAKQMKAMDERGLILASENYIDYAYTLLQQPRSALAEARSILAQYVEKPF